MSYLIRYGVTRNFESKFGLIGSIPGWQQSRTRTGSDDQTPLESEGPGKAPINEKAKQARCVASRESVVETGVDPVTSRFSGARSTN